MPPKSAAKMSKMERHHLMVAGGAARSVIGQVVPLDVGLTMDVDDQATQEMDVETVNSDASPLLVPQATDWCDWCRDFSSSLFYCTKCTHKICAASAPGQSGCIRADTMSGKKPFLCPNCSVDGIRYWIQGALGGPIHNKILWPAVILTLSLKSTQDSYYAANRVALDMANEYRTYPSNLHITKLTMQANAQNAQKKKAEGAVAFIQQTVSRNIPANTIIFIDTHSCSNTGCLQYGGGRNSAVVLNVHDLITGFIGHPFLAAMKEASTLGRTPVVHKAVDSRLNVTNPGGLKILIIMSCGPCMTNDDHRRICEQEIQTDRYDALIAFTGDTTLPEFVMEDLIRIITNFTVNQERDVWTVMTKSLKHAERLLRHSPLTVIFKFKGQVCCREFALHDPPSTVLGCTFFCGSLNCQALPGELRYRNKLTKTTQSILQECRRCRYRSKYLDMADVQWVHLVSGSKRVYWHEYPMTPGQQALFGEVQVKTLVGGDVQLKRARADTGEGDSRKKRA